MDSLLVSLVSEQVPSLVASHPKAALGAMTLYAVLEWVWPRLKLKGDSTPDILFHILKAGVKAVFKKG